MLMTPKQLEKLLKARRLGDIGAGGKIPIRALSTRGTTGHTTEHLRVCRNSLSLIFE
jgi:hypothetical protein